MILHFAHISHLSALRSQLSVLISRLSSFVFFGLIVAVGLFAMMKQLLEILREYRFIDRAILFLRLFVGVLIALHIIDKLQTYNFVLTGYPALLFDNSWATFVIFTALEALFAVMIILGYGTRFAAFIMALGMFVEIFIIYPSLGWLGVERQILYIGIYITLVVSGSGRYGLESRLDRKRKNVKF